MRNFLLHTEKLAQIMASQHSHTNESSGSGNAFYGYIMILGVMVTTAGLTETTEVAESKFNYPFIVRYICMATGMIAAIPLLAWKLCSPTTLIIKSDKKLHFYAWAFVGSISLTGAGMIYFLSFDGISVPSGMCIIYPFL